MKKSLVSITGGDFIDPSDCGSYIRYRFTVQEVSYEENPESMYLQTSMDMSLGDCSRAIGWGFHSDDDASPLEKMDAILRIMRTAREHLVLALHVQAEAKARLDAIKTAAAEAKKNDAG